MLEALRTPEKAGKYDIVIDGVMGTPDALRYIPETQAQGHRVVLVGVTIDPVEGMVRAFDRAGQKGRWVPAEVLAKAHKGFNENLPTLMKQADQVYLYDNTGKTHLKLATKARLEGPMIFAKPEFRSIIETRGAHEVRRQE